MKNYLVLDAGGTFIKYALMDENAVILEKDKAATPSYLNSGKEDFYQVLDGIVEKYRSMLSGIAISMPGMLDSQKGYCMTAGYLTYLAGTPVADELSLRYGFPVTVENDGKCAALAEYWKGSLKGCTNGAVVVLGSGVAGGLILNGRLYRGSHFTAGEYSYICNHEERFEEMDSFWGMNGAANGLFRIAAKHLGGDWQDYDGFEVFRRANEGDPKTLMALKEYTDSLGVQIYNLNILLDLDIIAIGGGISQQPLLLEYLKKSLEEIDHKNPLRSLTPYIPRPQITNCTYYNDSNLIGALYHDMKLKGEL